MQVLHSLLSILRRTPSQTRSETTTRHFLARERRRPFLAITRSGKKATELIQSILVELHRAHEGVQLRGSVVRHLLFNAQPPRSRPPGDAPPCVLRMSACTIHPYGFLMMTRRARTLFQPPPTRKMTRETELTLDDHKARLFSGDILWVSWAPQIHFGLNYTTCFLIRAFDSLCIGYRNLTNFRYSEPIILTLILATAIILVIQASRTVVLPLTQLSPPPQQGYFQTWEDYALFVLYILFT